ncbi:protocatechuate 3,4-dioxygenase [Myxococcus sp. K38C18041901]|uniref:dioxygenase family protein n=1 Tax=Myxococcus guangdongensis TaxID=2906760 RepID=UPI0020A77828|nr:protocatechuate 3,4-dioxygenase [Myxococcus guangdongensis]MCP3062608.1 protocatechuate 3,4-dioxygenase [Myxococcus guangdongensis]
MSNQDTKTLTSAIMSRRKVLRGMGLTLAAIPLVQVLACGPEDAPAPGGDTDSGSTPDGGTSATAWATGGTAVMSGTYANPFTEDPGTTCALTCAATLGPCYAETLVRQDISEGHDGLPVRLAFRILDDQCRPIQGASVDIWHAAPEGLYSGEDASTFCTSDDPSATSARWFRGVQVTDADGRCDFDTCFPGWYSSRTVHIHFTVRIGEAEYVTSQLFFDDALNDDIINHQPLYDTRGPRDTTNANDNVVSAESVNDYLFQTARQDDGALLAWKTLIIRSSLDTAQCQIPGGNGGGGGGGPPPGGDGGMGPPPGWDGGMGPPPGTPP